MAWYNPFSWGNKETTVTVTEVSPQVITGKLSSEGGTSGSDTPSFTSTPAKKGTPTPYKSGGGGGGGGAGDSGSLFSTTKDTGTGYNPATKVQEGPPRDIGTPVVTKSEYNKGVKNVGGVPTWVMETPTKDVNTLTREGYYAGTTEIYNPVFKKQAGVREATLQNIYTSKEIFGRETKALKDIGLISGAFMKEPELFTGKFGVKTSSTPEGTSYELTEEYFKTYVPSYQDYVGAFTPEGFAGIRQQSLTRAKDEFAGLPFMERLKYSAGEFGVGVGKIGVGVAENTMGLYKSISFNIGKGLGVQQTDLSKGYTSPFKLAKGFIPIPSETKWYAVKIAGAEKLMSQPTVQSEYGSFTSAFTKGNLGGYVFELGSRPAKTLEIGAVVGGVYLGIKGGISAYNVEREMGITRIGSVVNVGKKTISPFIPIKLGTPVYIGWEGGEIKPYYEGAGPLKITEGTPYQINTGATANQLKLAGVDNKLFSTSEGKILWGRNDVAKYTQTFVDWGKGGEVFAIPKTMKLASVSGVSLSFGKNVFSTVDANTLGLGYRTTTTIGEAPVRTGFYDYGKVGYSSSLTEGFLSKSATLPNEMGGTTFSFSDVLFKPQTSIIKVEAFKTPYGTSQSKLITTKGGDIYDVKGLTGFQELRSGTIPYELKFPDKSFFANVQAKEYITQSALTSKGQWINPKLNVKYLELVKGQGDFYGFGGGVKGGGGFGGGGKSQILKTTLDVTTQILSPSLKQNQIFGSIGRVTSPSVFSSKELTASALMTKQGQGSSQMSVQQLVPKLKLANLNKAILNPKTSFITKSAFISPSATAQVPKSALKSNLALKSIFKPSIFTPAIPSFVVPRTFYGGGFPFPYVPKMDLNFKTPSKIYTGKLPSRYTPSYEALVFNIRGKQPKGRETGLRIRPIPKGFSFFDLFKKKKKKGGK